MRKTSRIKNHDYAILGSLFRKEKVMKLLEESRWNIEVTLLEEENHSKTQSATRNSTLSQNLATFISVEHKLQEYFRDSKYLLRNSSGRRLSCLRFKIDSYVGIKTFNPNFNSSHGD
jgi:hypothetical protein